MGAAEIAMILRIGGALYEQYRAGKLTEEQLAQQWDLLIVPNFKAALDEWNAAETPQK